MGVFITLIGLGCFLLLMTLYKICQIGFLRNDKTKIEEIGFLSDSVLNFLEFAVLVVTFLVVESIALDTANVEAKMWFILACFCLFVLDDIVLYKKIKK